MITADSIMATRPCKRYSREVVDRLLAEAGPLESWEAAAIAARDRSWRDVSLADLRLTVYRAATPAQRLRGVVYSTRVRVEAQRRRWPEVSEATAEVRRRILAWDGDHDEIRRIRAYAADGRAAAAADAAAYAAYDASADYADTYAAYAAADAAYADADAYADYAACQWDGLIYICRLVDGAQQ